MHFNIAQLALGLSLAASSSFAAPTKARLHPRSVIDSDAVVGFDETVPDTTAGTLMLKYKPYLKVFNGCVPFPAVDAEGNTGGGLAPTGASDGDCDSSTGQIYARAETYNDAFAIMYSWYMPKDEPSDGLGHRHDWENIVLWLSSESTDATVLGAAISAHGDYNTYDASDLTFVGDGLLVGYISYWPLDHQLIDTTTEGGTQPLIAWDSMTTAAQTAIEDTDFGDATPSFRDSNFESYLAEAEL